MCDVLLDLPAVYEPALTTIPIYKSTYVLVYRSDRGYAFKDFDDPALKGLKIGVFQTSSIRQVMTKKGLAPYLKLKTLSHNADLHPENQPWRQVQEVIDGSLDVAGVWGPFAGWLKTMKSDPITLQPVNLWEDIVPMEYELAAGVRKTDAKLKYLLDLVLEDSKAEIEKILTDYGVPLVQCSTCLVQGNLPAHGAYIKPASTEYKAKPEAASPDQVVTEQRLEAWLAEGADLNQELSNAVLASDQARIKFLVKKGADLNALDPQGYAQSTRCAQATSRAHRAVRRPRRRPQRARQRWHDAAAARSDAQSRTEREDAARTRRRHRGEEQGRIYRAGACHCRGEIRGGQAAARCRRAL